MQYWINMTHGLELEPISLPSAPRGNENGILFLVVYYTLKELRGELTSDDVNTFCQIVENLETYNPNTLTKIHGLYDRGGSESNPQHPEHPIKVLSRGLEV